MDVITKTFRKLEGYLEAEKADREWTRKRIVFLENENASLLREVERLAGQQASEPLKALLKVCKAVESSIAGLTPVIAALEAERQRYVGK